MKIRAGFVSNSSSSSFVVKISRLSKRERNRLQNYMLSEYNHDSWDMHENNGELHGYTIMDNGSLEDFLVNEGIDIEAFEWDED